MLDQTPDEVVHTPNNVSLNIAWAIACDFDGTISLQDTTDAVLAEFATSDWLRIEAQFEAGAISSGVCMRDQVALIRASADKLEAFVRSLELDPDFSRFVQLAAFYQLPMQVMSDGLDHNVKLALKHLCLNLAFAANTLEPNGPNRWRMRSPYADATCRVDAGTCKCRLMTKLAQQTASSEPLSRVLLIGDGRSDFCAAAQADFVFAKGKLLRYCQEHGIAHAPIHNFSDACTLLPALLEGELGAPDLDHRKTTAFISSNNLKA